MTAPIPAPGLDANGCATDYGHGDTPRPPGAPDECSRDGEMDETLDRSARCVKCGTVFSTWDDAVRAMCVGCPKCKPKPTGGGPETKG